jgi:predicted enzyme related to lactoylglutathione lyase
VETNFLNTVILAGDYDAVVEWYVNTFDLDIGTTVDEDYHYTELTRNGKLVIAIADAKEMGVIPSQPRNNSLIVQLSLSNIKEAFQRIMDNGGTILFGPSLDEKWEFYYGGFYDIEGNQIWVIEDNKVK